MLEAKFFMFKPDWSTKEVEYIAISRPDSKDVLHLPATDEHRQKYAAAYAEFKKPPEA